jgi:Ras-related protein Rab-1A
MVQAEEYKKIENLYDSLFKILIVGDINTGKTSILDQFANGHFDGSYISTIGIDFNVKIIPVDKNVNVKLQVWDTCGQERFRALTRSYYRNANAVVIVYDITNRNTFEKAKIWIKEIEDYIDSDVLRVLVGNKSDLFTDRKIQYFDGHSLAEENYMQFFETSAKYDNNIETLFKFIADKLYSTLQMKKKKDGTIPLKKPFHRKCC